MNTNQPTQAEKRKYGYQIQIGDRVEMVHRDDPYHPGRDPNVGKVGTVTRVVDGAWGERATFKADDGTIVGASTHELLHVVDATSINRGFGPTTQDNTMNIPPGPFAAPEGSTEKTYQVTITTVVPMTHTDPADWDFEALLETIRDQAHGADVQSVEMTPGGAA